MNSVLILVLFAIISGLIVIILAIVLFKEKTGSLKGRIEVIGIKFQKGTEVFLAHLNDEEEFALVPKFDKKGRQLLTYTDDNGQFFFKEVPCGAYWVVAKREGFKVHMKLVSVKENTESDAGCIKIRH